MQAQDLFSWQAPPPKSIMGDRSGITYIRDRDLTRLNAQALRVYRAMEDGAWRSLEEIYIITGDPQASISARIRDLRKPEFTQGKFTTERRHVKDGLYEYRMVFL